MTPRRRAWGGVADDIVAALERAAVAIGRLDDALAGHPLLPAWSYWTGIETACRHAAADGWKADPYRLAAYVEGLPLRTVGASLMERGLGHDALAQALALRSWLACPDEDQARLLAHAVDHLAQGGKRQPVLLGAAHGMADWLAGRGSRRAIRAGMPRYLHRCGLTRAVLPPLTGNDALRADPDGPDDPDAFATRFLAGLTREAESGRDRLRSLDYAWREGRGKVAARAGARSTSSLPRAVDLLAAAPLIGVAGLAHALDCSTVGAAKLLDQLVALEVAVEVTGSGRRGIRRLYGLKHLLPVRAETEAPAARPAMGGSRGRPKKILVAPMAELEEGAAVPPAPGPLPDHVRSAPASFDYAPLDRHLSDIDAATRRIQRLLAGQK